VFARKYRIFLDLTLRGQNERLALGLGTDPVVPNNAPVPGLVFKPSSSGRCLNGLGSTNILFKKKKL
jgi:hypothetical protein